MGSIVLSPLSGSGRLTRIAAWARRMASRRLLLRLAGVDSVVLQGRVYAVRPVPLGVARDLVPAMVRCSRRFAEWDIDEALYDDMVRVLSLGLRAKQADVESLSIALWDLAPVIESIARANGMPLLESGADAGKWMGVLTGTNSMPGSSAAPDGPGKPSTAA